MAKFFAKRASAPRHHQVVVISVPIFLCAMMLGTIRQVSGITNGTDSKLAEAESFDITDEFSAIMTELLKSKSTTNVTENAKPGEKIPMQNVTTAAITALHSNSNSSNSNAGDSSSTKTKRTCACDDSEETLICASNGVTYKNSCRFECAKARVNRLRQVKEGRCSQAAGAQSYWGGNKSG